MTERMYVITYEEDEEQYQAVIPESLLPDFEYIIDIEVAGRLLEGYKVVVDEDPDPGEKEPIILKTGTNAR